MPLKINSSSGGSVSLDAPSSLVGANTITLPSTSGGTFLTTPLAAGTTTAPPIDFTAGTNMTTPDTGAMEYDGKALYFTPQGTQRGVVPGMQFYRLNTAVVGTTGTSAQNILGVGCTLSSSTVYAFQAVYAFSKTLSTASHTFGFGFGGTATVNNIAYMVIGNTKSNGFAGVSAPDGMSYVQTTANTTVNTANTAAGAQFIAVVVGTVSVNAGGTFIPQYTLSSATAGAYTTAIGSYFLIYPLGASGANTSVGTWA